MRKFLKRALLFFCVIIVSPLIFIAWGGFLLKLEEPYRFFGTFLSLLPGLPGSYLRLAFYKGTLARISSDVTIGFGSYFSRPSARVGKNVSIGAYCIIGNAVIGDDVLIASRVSIPSGLYQHSDPWVPHEFRGAPRFDKVVVGSRAWIGEGAIVLADVGEDSIVAAGCVLFRPMPSGYVIAGNPGKPAKKRDLNA